MKKRVKVQLEEEFDARAIAKLVQIANGYHSRIYLESGGARVNAKSIMGMMSFGSGEGAEITVDTEGEDEAEAAAAIESFFAE